MANSPHLLIPLVDAGTDQPEVQVNEGLNTLDTAFNQEHLIDVTAEVDGSRNITLTSDDFRKNYAHLLQNGDASDFNLVVPTGQRVFYVENQTADACTVTAGGATVIVPASELALLRQDAANDLSTIARASINGNPYDIVASFMGQLTDGQALFQGEIVRNLTFVTDLVGSRASSGVNPSSNVTINIQKNGGTFNTLTINTSGVGTFGTSVETTFAPGDILGMVVNGAANGIENVRITLKGAR